MMERKILIVDDDPLNIEILVKILSDDYGLETACSGVECLDKLMSFAPDIILLDIMMPGMDGYEVCRRIKSMPHGDLINIILLSGKGSTKDRLDGYEAGADDYLIKPFDHDELLARMRIHLRLRDVLVELARAKAKTEISNAQLEELVQRRTAEVIETRDITVFALAKLAESRDSDTGEHLERIRSYSQILAESMIRGGPYRREIDDPFLHHLYLSSPLHDIGKVGIPDAVLLKPGRLNNTEFEIMKRHTIIGADALTEAAAHTRSGGFLKMAAQIARWHHERYDGSGYPDGLIGRDIPLSARIVAVADVFDALTSVRVYKSAIGPELAKSMIERENDRHFDPVIVESFQTNFDAFLNAYRQRPDVQRDAEKAVIAST